MSLVFRKSEDGSRGPLKEETVVKECSDVEESGIA